LIQADRQLLPIRLRSIFLNEHLDIAIAIKFNRKLKTINDFYGFYLFEIGKKGEITGNKGKNSKTEGKSQRTLKLTGLRN
jgi:hypothetical protein